MQMTRDELEQYSQQLKMSEIGLNGQTKLKNSRVLCVGAGGLGSSLLLHLASAGVGTIGIVDHDIIELSNLNRQILYQREHLGYKKAMIAREQLLRRNPLIKIEAIAEKLGRENAHCLLSDYDIIADCSDNFSTRYLINETAYHLDKPYIFASVSKFSGHCSLFLGKKSSCFSCLFPVIPCENIFSSCFEEGILGVLPGLMGVIQATEIIKWILGLETGLAHRLLIVNALTMEFKILHCSKNKYCALCAS